MGKVVNMTYASSLSNLCEVNSSFDTGILRICYTGDNRNGSSISKQAIEKSLPTIYNCPIVCNYNRESDSLGGHDMEVVASEDGSLRLVNMTQPVGVIPESAKVWFDNYEEEDGTVHEYLYAEVLIWKRQEAYRKLKDDGITAHSMELTVKDGQTVNGVYHINDFEFTAFALIGVEPCFEGSALEMFSMNEFKAQFSQMMQELKENCDLVSTATYAADDTNKNLTEGGEKVLEQKIELASKYGIDVNALDFEIDDMSIEELEKIFEEMTTEVHDEAPAVEEAEEHPAAEDGEVDDHPAAEEHVEEADEGVEEIETPEDPAEEQDQEFALSSTVIEEIQRNLDSITVTREWGECHKYWYVDCDLEANEVYCWDVEDWLLYGFSYAMSGDAISIDLDSKKRMKYAIVAFDNGEQLSPVAQAFSAFEQRLIDNADLEAKYQTASSTISDMQAELNELREFKASVEKSAADAARAELFAKFENLTGIEAFETLKANCEKYDLETLEEKCYAILGRNGTVAKFALKETTPKLKVGSTAEHIEPANEPYGGIFIRRGFIAENK